MKSLSAIAKELGVSVATVSYVYNDKWRENRIHPDLAERVRSKLAAERAAPDTLGRQLQSGRTQIVGVLLPHLEQPYLLKLLAGIEQRLGESDYMALLGIAQGRRDRQAKLAERMLGRRVDALIVCPRPDQDLGAYLASIRQVGDRPLIFVDNYLPECPAGCVVSDNRWGAMQAVRKMLEAGRRRVLFVGGDSTVAALGDRHQGYCDALDAAGLPRDDSLTVWRDRGDEPALEAVGRLLRGTPRPDAIFATSFFRFFPFLELLGGLGLRHPGDVMLGGFDEPMESWAADTVRRVVREPLVVVQQAAAEMGRAAVDAALAAIDGADASGLRQVIQPILTWQLETSKPRIPT